MTKVIAWERKEFIESKMEFFFVPKIPKNLDLSYKMVLEGEHYSHFLVCPVHSSRTFEHEYLLDQARGYKTFFVLNSTKHEISNTHKK